MTVLFGDVIILYRHRRAVVEYVCFRHRRRHVMDATAVSDDDVVATETSDL